MVKRIFGTDGLNLLAFDGIIVGDFANEREGILMKRLILCTLIVIGTVTVLSAQSGRKIRNPIPGTASAGVTPAQTATEEAEAAKTAEIGFSESATNQPVSIFVDRERRRSNKSSKKTESETKSKAPEAQTKPADVDSEDEVIKVETNLISLPVTVSTRSGSYVPSLSKGNFKIFEDGVEQEVAYFGNVDKPFTAILLIDVSGSTSLKIEQIQDGAIAFVNQLLPQDRVMVVSFDSGVSTLIEYSNDRPQIIAAIRKLRFGGGTSLFDAVDFALNRKIAKIEGKKAIVLFTDGVDTTSRRSYESTVADAIESDAAIFPVYLNTFLDAIGIGGGGGVMSTPPTIGIPGGVGGGSVSGTREEYARGRRYLQDLANATGGRIYRPDNSSVGLTTAFEGIAEELRSQYEVGYYPTKEARPGDVKKIKIRIDRPNLIIRSRDSYVVK